MNDVPQSILEGREAIGPWNYSARIPDGASSKEYALIQLVVAVMFGGIGMFFGSDVARNVPFLSNAAVLVALLLSVIGVLLSAWMFVGHWVWTAPQMALFGIAGLALVIWAFQGAPLVAFVLYSKTPLVVRVGVLLLFLVWQGWWIWQTTSRCMSIWADVPLRERVWIPYDCATVYRRSAAKSAMDSAGVVWHPGTFGILLPFFLCLPFLYIYRHEVTEFLDAPWVPVAIFVLGLPIFVVCTTTLTTCVVAMLVIPARIVASTGNPVLVDMMTPANAPR